MTAKDFSTVTQSSEQSPAGDDGLQKSPHHHEMDGLADFATPTTLVLPPQQTILVNHPDDTMMDSHGQSPTIVLFRPVEGSSSPDVIRGTNPLHPSSTSNSTPSSVASGTGHSVLPAVTSETCPPSGEGQPILYHSSKTRLPPLVSGFSSSSVSSGGGCPDIHHSDNTGLRLSRHHQPPPPQQRQHQQQRSPHRGLSKERVLAAAGIPVQLPSSDRQLAELPLRYASSGRSSREEGSSSTADLPSALQRSASSLAQEAAVENARRSSRQQQQQRRRQHPQHQQHPVFAPPPPGTAEGGVAEVVREPHPSLLQPLQQQAGLYPPRTTEEGAQYQAYIEDLRQRMQAVRAMHFSRQKNHQ